MSDTKPTNKKRSGVITFLDVLGWKGVYDRQTNAIESLRRLIESLKSKAQQQRGRLSGGGEPVDVKSISDTIALFTLCSENEVTTAIEIHGELCQWLIPESIKMELPMRGATAYGDFEVIDNIFVGKAVDEAASWHEQGNWIGVNLSPSAEFAFLTLGKNSAWVPFAAPIKVPMKWQPHCVNWVADWDFVAVKTKDVQQRFQRMGPILPEIAPKFINTLAFIKEFAKGKPFNTGLIVVLVEGYVDAKVVEVIANKSGLKRQVHIEKTQGKGRMLEYLKAYAHDFREAAGIVVLTDADTNDKEDVRNQRAQFQKIINESERPDAKVVFAVPEIEAWLGRTEFKRDRIDNFNKVSEELYHLQEEIEQRAQRIPSLAEFIDALKSIDSAEIET